MIKFALILTAVFVFTCVVGLIDEQLQKRKAVKKRTEQLKESRRAERQRNRIHNIIANAEFETLSKEAMKEGQGVSCNTCLSYNGCDFKAENGDAICNKYRDKDTHRSVKETVETLKKVFTFDEIAEMYLTENSRATLAEEKIKKYERGVDY